MALSWRAMGEDETSSVFAVAADPVSSHVTPSLLLYRLAGTEARLICRLPGDNLAAPIQEVPGGAGLLVSTGDPWESIARPGYAPVAFLTWVSFNPEGTPSAYSRISAVGWRQSLAGAKYNNQERTDVAMVGARRDEYGTWRGRLDVIQDLSSPAALKASHPITWPLVGAPVIGEMASGKNLYMALCRRQDGSIALQILDVSNGKERLSPTPIRLGDGKGVGVEPLAMALSPDEEKLFVLVSSPWEGVSPEARNSWLSVVDLTDMTFAGKALSLPGVPHWKGMALAGMNAHRSVAATHVPGSDMAQITEIHEEKGEWKVTSERHYLDCPEPLRLSAQRGGGGYLVWSGRWMMVCGENAETSKRVEFAGLVTAALWEGARVYTAEEDRIHEVDPLTGSILRTITLGASPIHEIRVASQLAMACGTTEDTSDVLASCGMPPFVRLTMGTEPVVSHKISLRQPDTAIVPYQWTVKQEDPEAEWLHAQPVEGTLPGGLDLTARKPGDSATGLLDASLRFQVTTDEAGLTQERGAMDVHMRVEPPATGSRPVLWVLGRPPGSLWLRDATDPVSFKELADLLSASPMYMSHQESWGPSESLLASHDVVVMTATALLEGAVTRPALLEYVSRGGSLLFLSEHPKPENAERLSLWFAPLGVLIDGTNAVNSVVDHTPGEEGLTRHWHSFRIEQGSPIRLAGPVETDALIGQPGVEYVFVALRYGQGRVALLASSSPIRSEQMRNVENRLFAQDVFSWLTRKQLSPLSATHD